MEFPNSGTGYLSEWIDQLDNRMHISSDQHLEEYKKHLDQALDEGLGGVSKRKPRKCKEKKLFGTTRYMRQCVPKTRLTETGNSRWVTKTL